MCITNSFVKSKFAIAQFFSIALLSKYFVLVIIRLSSDDEEETEQVYDVKKAHERLTTLSESSDDPHQRFIEDHGE